MNGAKPDVVVWSTPTDEVNGIDKQLEKAVEVLLKDVKEAPAIHQDPIYKSQR